MLDWKRIVLAIKHQKMYLLLTAVLLGGLGTYAISSLPSIFESNARILVERRGLFSESTPTQMPGAQDTVSRRMHAISSMVLSTDSIRSIMTEFELLTDPDDPETLARAVTCRHVLRPPYRGPSEGRPRWLKTNFPDGMAQRLSACARAARLLLQVTAR